MQVPKYGLGFIVVRVKGSYIRVGVRVRARVRASRVRVRVSGSNGVLDWD